MVEPEIPAPLYPPVLILPGTVDFNLIKILNEEIDVVNCGLTFSEATKAGPDKRIRIAE